MDYGSPQYNADKRKKRGISENRGDPGDPPGALKNGALTYISRQARAAIRVRFRKPGTSG